MNASPLETRWLEQSEPLRTPETRVGPRERGARRVLAATPGPWDRAPGGSAPRRPGGVYALAGEKPKEVLLCAGFLPCGSCVPCQTGLSLACQDPSRPGWNAAGGLAEHAPAGPWLIPLSLEEAALPAALALVAGAGLAYQAMASAGMVPGDTVAVVGDLGPGALPLRLLAAAGLRVLQLGAPARPLPEGVDRIDRLIPGELPSARCHLIDLAPSSASLPRWLAEASCLKSATLCGPPPGSVPADLSTLGGECALRWVRDLHPHLAFDVCAFVATGRVELTPALQIVHSLEELGPHLVSFQRGELERWPVLSLHDRATTAG